MKALVLTKTQQPLEEQDIPAPRPGPGEIVVEIKAAALNRRDYWITQGKYPGIKLPVVLGSDGAGVVSRIGSEVDPAWIGREVLINPGMNWGDQERAQGNGFHILGMPMNGTLAQEVAVPAGQVRPKPAHLSWPEAGALPLAGLTAYRALFEQGELRPNQTVLITGIGGGVASFALQLAVSAGASVWVTSSSPAKIQEAVALGARGGFNYSDTHWAEEFAKQAGAADLIIDGAAGRGYGSLLEAATPGGRIVNYGATAGPPEKLDMFKVFWKQLHLIGSTMGSPKDFDALLAFVEKHRIKPVLDETLPWRQANQALEQMAASSQFGKLTLIMG